MPWGIFKFWDKWFWQIKTNSEVRIRRILTRVAAHIEPTVMKTFLCPTPTSWFICWSDFPEISSLRSLLHYKHGLDERRWDSAANCNICCASNRFRCRKMFNNRIQKRYDSFGFRSRDLTYPIKGAAIRLSNSCCVSLIVRRAISSRRSNALFFYQTSCNRYSTWQWFLSDPSTFTKKIVTFWEGSQSCFVAQNVSYCKFWLFLYLHCFL